MKKKLGMTMALGVLALLVAGQSLAADQPKKVTLHLLSHRYAALEFYADALVKEAPENVKVEADLTTYADWQQKMTINLSSHSSAFDITYIYPTDLAQFASKGWLMPLDDLIKKYDAEFHFSDIPDYVWEVYRYKGKIYGIPHHQWATFLFYRKDVFKKNNIAIPQTLDEYVSTAAKLTNKNQYGALMWLKPADFLSNQFQIFLTACGGWWFDKNNKPAVNSPEAMLAIEYIKKLLPYSPPGVMNFGTDEGTVALAQGQSAMGIHWGTRASTMDNPEQSKVVGLIGFAPSPSLKRGGNPASMFATAGYAISAFSKNDPDLIFQTIARATDSETQKRGAVAGMPVRLSAITPELLKERPDYDATIQALKSGARMRPTFPEFNEIQEITMRYLAKALAGQMDTQAAMDAAAKESTVIMEHAGYYKK